MSINDVISANFQIVYVIKIVKTKIRKQKLWLLLYIPPFNFYVNFPLPSITFEKLNLVTNNKYIMLVTDINLPKSCSKNN